MTLFGRFYEKRRSVLIKLNGSQESSLPDKAGQTRGSDYMNEYSPNTRIFCDAGLLPNDIDGFGRYHLSIFLLFVC
jgi:hypothetical protein